MWAIFACSSLFLTFQQWRNLEGFSHLINHVGDICGGYRCADCRQFRQNGTSVVTQSVGFESSYYSECWGNKYPSSAGIPVNFWNYAALIKNWNIERLKKYKTISHISILISNVAVKIIWLVSALSQSFQFQLFEYKTKTELMVVYLTPVLNTRTTVYVTPRL